MRYLLDPRSGQIRGKFTVDYDLDNDNSIDYLVFSFEEVKEMPTLEVEGTQFYIDFANIIRPGKTSLLQEDWQPLKDFERFTFADNEDVFDKELLLKLARKIGPLFGSYDEASGVMSETEIREPISCWLDAARTLSFAIRTQAYLAERSGDTYLDDEIYFTLHTNRDDKAYWECTRLYPDHLSSPYYEMLCFPKDEQERMLLPAREKTIPGYTFSTHWEPAFSRQSNRPWLSVIMVPDGMATPTLPVAYASHHYMASEPETEPVVRVLLSHMLRSLVLLHTHRIYHDLHDGFFGVAYNNLLERLWYNFAADAALGKLGVCEHCGRVFEAMSERKDRKVYCSKDCQEYAKSARNYRKRKIREAIKSEKTTDMNHLLHVLDDPKITREMVERVLAKNKSNE